MSAVRLKPLPSPSPRDIRSDLALRRQAQDMADRHAARRSYELSRYLGVRYTAPPLPPQPRKENDA